MKRKPKLTKRERKALDPVYAARRAAAPEHDHGHIHCIACGKHLELGDFDTPATATMLGCAHGSQFPACVGCATKAQAALDEHDRTNQPVKTAPVRH